MNNAGYINSKAQLHEFLEIERLRYGRKNTRIPWLCITESDYLWKHNVLLRKTEYYINTHKKVRGLIYKFRLRKFQVKYQLRIPLNAFDSGLRIMHLGSILVNRKTRGGKNISLHINTNMVAGGTNDTAPVLGDGIVVGVGATIVGNVHLANNIAIGANSVVNKSFAEENICIAGVPAKKVSNNGRLTWNQKANLI